MQRSVGGEAVTFDSCRSCVHWSGAASVSLKRVRQRAGIARTKGPRESKVRRSLSRAMEEFFTTAPCGALSSQKQPMLRRIDTVSLGPPFRLSSNHLTNASLKVWIVEWFVKVPRSIDHDNRTPPVKPRLQAVH